MVNLAVVFGVLLILPFLLGYIHKGVNKNVASVVLYYRYFMTFNMVLAGIFVTLRMFFEGHQAAAVSGWPYSPVFILYGIAILSMVVLGLFALYRRDIMTVAPAVCWITFLLLSAVAYIYEMSLHAMKGAPVVYLHVGYSLVVAVILLLFIPSVKKQLA